MKPIPSFSAPFKNLPICLGILPLFLLASCDQRKAEIDDRRDVTIDSIENRQDAVDREADREKEIVEANAEAEKIRIEAEAEAAEEELAADRARAEAEAKAAKAEIDAERARVDAERAETGTAPAFDSREVGIAPPAAGSPLDQNNR